MVFSWESYSESKPLSSQLTLRSTRVIVAMFVGPGHHALTSTQADWK